VLDNDQSAGATPAAGGATPPQSPPAPPAHATPPAAASTPPATDGDALGEGGKRALEAERAERKKLERELADLKAASLSDTEKALADAKKAGREEVIGKAQQVARRAEVRRALQAAGCVDVGIAAMATEFGALAVDDEGTVADLEKTVTAFKTAHPTLFGTASSPSWDATSGGAPGASAAGRVYTRAELRDVEFYAKHRADIEAASREPGQPRIRQVI